MEIKSLVTSFEDSISEEVSGCVTELTEIGLDAIMDEGLLKEIPFVSTAISIYKIGQSLKERQYVSKLAVFLDEINKGIADEAERSKYREKFRADQKFRHKELEYLLVLIDRYISFDKPQMRAKLYLAYLDGTIIWEEFTMYAEVIDRFLLLDCSTLLSTSVKTRVIHNIGGESVQRLVALGLMCETDEDSLFQAHPSGNVGVTHESLMRYQSGTKVYKRTEFGEKLANILC